jgi:hypothetical protein
MRTEPVPAQRHASIVAGYAAVITAVITAVKHSLTLALNGW